MTNYQHIEAEFKDGLGTITLNRPPLNVLNIAMMEEMNDVLQAWQGEKDLKVVLFNAKGKSFSAGVVTLPAFFSGELEQQHSPKAIMIRAKLQPRCCGKPVRITL